MVNMNKFKKWFMSIIINDPIVLIARSAIVFLFWGLVIALDQLTKIYVFDKIDPIDLKIISINAKHIWNNGVAFNTLAGYTVLIQTIGFIVFILSFILIFLRIRIHIVILIAMIAGGSMGNMIDRFQYTSVRDFLAFPWWPSFAVFNVADAFVTISAIALLIVLIVDIIKSYINDKKNQKNDETKS